MSSFQSQRRKAYIFRVMMGVGKKWQRYWDRETNGRHLHEVQSKIGRDVSKGNKKQQVITAVTVGKHPTGNCSQYGKRKTVEHVLTVCRRYETERIYTVTGLKRAG